jgi:hypothetical protein
MLSEKAYMDAAEVFGTSVGVAHIIGTKKIIELESKDAVIRYNDERYINSVILRCIERGKYELLQKTLYRLRKESGKRKVKEVTIYRKAWYYIVNGHDKTNKSKFGEILHQIG